MTELELQQARMLDNLLATMRTFASVRDSAEIWELDGMLCVYSGLPGAVFNSVLLTAEVESEKELRLKFDYVDALYRTRRAKWSMWLVDHLVPPRLLRRIRPLLEAYGVGAVSHASGMYCDQLAEPLRPLPKLEITRVLSPATRFDFCHVMAVSFLTPLATFLDVYNNPTYWQGPMHGYVAYSGNRAVATACILPGETALGVYGVAVLPDVRRRGIGERIVRYSLADVTSETGVQPSVLQSSVIAERLYTQLGYHRIAGVSIYNDSR